MVTQIPKTVQKAPFKIQVEVGKQYYWCSCGLSKSQPFCDGSHKGTGFKSIPFQATESKVVYFCGCKQNQGGVLCDGSHNKI